MAKETKSEPIVNVTEVYTKTELFVDKHRKTLFGVLGAIALLFVGFFAWQYLFKNPREEKAANALWKAQQWMEIDSTDLALAGSGEYEGFESIIANYEGTRSAKLAHYYSGIIYRDKGEFETALDHFLKADFNDEAVSVLAIGNAGDMHVQLGQLEEGAQLLEKAGRLASDAESRDFLAPVYLLKGAKAYIELGNNDKAEKMLQQVTDNFDSRSQEYNEAAKILAMLKAQE